MSEETKKEEGPRSFARFVEVLGDGDAHSMLSSGLHELTKKVIAEAKNRGAKAIGSITFVVGLKSDSKGNIEVAYDVTSKEPKPARGGDFFYATPGGNLTKQNIKQQSLPGVLRDVSAKAPSVDVMAKESKPKHPHVELADDEIFDPVTGEVTKTGFR